MNFFFSISWKFKKILKILCHLLKIVKKNWNCVKIKQVRLFIKFKLHQFITFFEIDHSNNFFHLIHNPERFCIFLLVSGNDSWRRWRIKGGTKLKRRRRRRWTRRSDLRRCWDCSDRMLLLLTWKNSFVTIKVSTEIMETISINLFNFFSAVCIFQKFAKTRNVKMF